MRSFSELQEKLLKVLLRDPQPTFSAFLREVFPEKDLEAVLPTSVEWKMISLARYSILSVLKVMWRNNAQSTLLEGLRSKFKGPDEAIEALRLWQRATARKKSSTRKQAPAILPKAPLPDTADALSSTGRGENLSSITNSKVCPNNPKPGQGHYFIVDVAAGPSSRGVCKLCKLEETFANSTDSFGFSRPLRGEVLTPKEREKIMAL